MKWGALLRQAVGMERAGDARSRIDPATGLPVSPPRTIALQVLCLRVALGGAAILPVAAVTAHAAGYWTGAYQWYETLRGRVAGLSAHESHSEVLKFVFADPSSVFYNDGGRGFSGASTPPPLSVGAVRQLPGKERAIQHIHDYWHTRYSDEIYRTVFKEGLVGVLLEDYLDWVWTNPTKFMLPDAWVRELPPEKLWRFSDTVERRWQDEGWRTLRFSMDNPQYYRYRYVPSSGGQAPFTAAWGDLNGDGVTSTFQLQGQVMPGQARTAPAMSESNPEE